MSGPIMVTRVPQYGGVTEEVIGCYAANTNFTIDLTQFSGWDGGVLPGYWIIHIYDSSADPDPTLSIGEVTISGATNDLVFLGVHVSGPTESWRENINTPLTNGCIDFGGLTISDSDTRNITAVSAAIGGDLGSLGIHANEILRVQVNGTDQGGGVITGGTIEGDLIAERANQSYEHGIGHVQAWNGITGNIEAKLGSIGTVRVVADAAVTPNPEGITGDILAEQGKIGTIWSSGPIGTVSANSQIKAANGIKEISCRIFDQFGSIGGPAEKDIHADIDATIGNVATGDVLDGAIDFIVTDGSFFGSIKAGNIYTSDGSGPFGILVRGIVDASIDVQYLVRGSIIGASFPQPVTIGLSLEGVLVATDEEEGEIAELSIGYASPVPGPYASAARGLTANAVKPTDPTSSAPLDAFTADDWLTPGNGVGATTPSFHGGSSDALVRAHHIGEARISLMATAHAGGLSSDRKEYAPRVEADIIDFIAVDDLREGVIWSGNIEFPSGVLNNTKSNDYASISELVIGDVGPYADVWFKDCTAAYFKGDVWGELHLPRLDATETISVAGLLNSYTQCSCTAYNAVTCPYPPPEGSYCENSPRSPNCSQPCAQPAAITIREEADEDALAGQIIINQDNASGLTSWGTGVVIIGDAHPGSQIKIGDSEPSPRTPPYYETRAGALGGGEIGLAPFHLQEIASFPEHASSTSRVLSSAFGAGTHALDKPVLVRHYGPVKLGTGATLSNSFAVDVRDPNDPCRWADMSMLFDFELDTDPAEGGRTVVVKAADTAHPPTRGTYRLRRTISTRLVCDNVDGNPPVVWPINCEGEDAEDEAYVFVIASDCNDNGLLDSLDIANTPSLDVDPEDGIIDECQDDGCEADFDGNQLVEADDIFAFLDAWFAQNGICTSSCSADFNGVDDVTADDIFAFLDTWFAQNGTLCDP